MKKLLLVLFMLSVTGSVLAQTLYTWVDDEGTRHYSAKPPEDYSYEEIGDANQVTMDPETLAAMERARAEAEAETEEEEEKPAADNEMDPEELAKNCTEINDQLAVYEQRLETRTAENEEGDEKARELYDQEMSALAEVRERLQQHCD